MSRVIVIGGGAAGMMTAIMAAREGHRVTLLEKNQKLGRKIYITGKGRCNLTNVSEREEFFRKITSNPRFFFSAYAGMDNYATIDFFEGLGLKTKVERGNRVFPESDHAYEVIDVCLKELRRLRVTVLTGKTVSEILFEPLQTEMPESGKKKKQQTLQAVGVRTRDGETLLAEHVVVATGGLSYPTTGSTGDGYVFAKAAGHEIVPCIPALVSLVAKESWCREVSGLSLKNVGVSIVSKDGKELFSEQGEMLFTHRGVSGPLVLTATAYSARALGEGGLLYLDLKPALTLQQLDARLARDIEAGKNKQLKNFLASLMPASLAQTIAKTSPVREEAVVGQLTRAEREALAKWLKSIPLTITALGGYEEAVITKGGVSVSEVMPQTMESRLAKGLYFVGEVLDLDACTGGYNLQLAWSTGAACGRNLR